MGEYSVTPGNTTVLPWENYNGAMLVTHHQKKKSWLSFSYRVYFVSVELRSKEIPRKTMSLLNLLIYYYAIKNDRDIATCIDTMSS